MWNVFLHGIKTGSTKKNKAHTLLLIYKKLKQPGIQLKTLVFLVLSINLMFWARSAGAEPGCHCNLFCFTKKDFRLHPSRNLTYTKWIKLYIYLALILKLIFDSKYKTAWGIEVKILLQVTELVEVLAKDCNGKPDGAASLRRHAQILNLIKPLASLLVNLIFTPRIIKHYGIQF